ncbi:MAG TPA: hypothetical protein VNB64_14150 [Solirubrobacteraceae bacterium]|nr:hypothetical protein [Solirubrobacteraceae bacterium]
METIVVLALFLGLAGASLRWGHDSRPGLELSAYDEVRGRIDGFIAQARADALVRKATPGWPRQLAGRAGTFLVGAGHRLQSYGESVVIPSRLAVTSDCSIQSGL